MTALHARSQPAAKINPAGDAARVAAVLLGQQPLDRRHDLACALRLVQFLLGAHAGTLPTMRRGRVARIQFAVALEAAATGPEAARNCPNWLVHGLLRISERWLAISGG